MTVLYASLSSTGHMLTGIANEPLIICERIKGLLIHDQEEIWAIPPLLFQENLHADIRKESPKQEISYSEIIVSYGLFYVGLTVCSILFNDAGY